MLRDADPCLGLASALPQPLDPMCPLSPHMVWTSLDIAKVAHYIKLALVKIGPFYPIFTLGKLALPSFYPPSDGRPPVRG